MVAEMKCGGVMCSTINDEHFSRVRSFFGISDDFLADTFDFDALAPAGGKGGDNMTRTKDSIYFIKEMNPGDFKVLKDPVFAAALADRVTDSAVPSILAPMLVHFSNPATGKVYVALRSAVPVPPAPLTKLYDLKGCADDKLLTDNGVRVPEVHKRIWRLDLWFGCGGPARAKYFNGKLEALHHPHIPMTEAQKESVLEAIRHDCNFLEANQLMDYSLIVGCCDNVEAPRELNGNLDMYAGKPLLSKADGSENGEIAWVGIIDYLQRWNSAKTIAKTIKSFERNKATVPPKPYAKRFVTHFDHVLHAVDGDIEHQIERRLARNLPHRCYPFLKK